MSRTHGSWRFVTLVMLAAALAACNSDSTGTASNQASAAGFATDAGTQTSPQLAAAGKSISAQPAPAVSATGQVMTVSGVAADVAADSNVPQTFNLTATAGIESGLVRLAVIRDTIAIGHRDDVTVSYTGNPVTGSPRPGKLYYCDGLAGYTNCVVYGIFRYDTPGTYLYTVTYEASGIGDTTISISGTITVEPPGDFVIVSIGDSVASGEGNPQLPKSPLGDGPYWNDFSSTFGVGLEQNNDVLPCHRSTIAGPVAAVRSLQEENSITFLHIACSGAVLGNEVAADRNRPGYRYGQLDKVNVQLAWAREHLPRIDVLIVTAGANNVGGGFGTVVQKCVLQVPWKSCRNDGETPQRLSSSIADLPSKYADLANLIHSGGTRDQQPDAVVIAEYFDPTHDADGDFPSLAESIACGLDAVNPDEWKFLYDQYVVPLNLQVGDAAHDWGWNLAKVQDAFLTHGYCSWATLPFGGESWVVGLGESQANQQDNSGTAHPNATGHDQYRSRIESAIVQSVPPRTAATATTNGEPYAFGTWVNTDVEVTLAAVNPIKAAGVQDTFYAAGGPLCTSESAASGACTAYSNPFLVTESGRNTVSFFSTSQFGARETRAEPVEVLIDREPPVMTCSATPDELWPPNKEVVDVTVAVTAIDEVSGPADFWLSGISDSYGAAGDSIFDFEVGVADTEGAMLADRGGGAGTRTYTLTYSSSDHIGNTGSCDVVVEVPHDQGRR